MGQPQSEVIQKMGLPAYSWIVELGSVGVQFGSASPPFPKSGKDGAPGVQFLVAVCPFFHDSSGRLAPRFIFMVTMLGEVLYALTIGLAIASWLLWWRSRADVSPGAARVLMIGLVLLSASLAQHISGVIYQDVLGQHVQHFSPQFGIFVKGNIILCAGTIIAAIVTIRRNGPALAAGLLVGSSCLLFFFWAMTQIM